MVRIRINPAHGSQGGWLTASGHAGNDLVCNSVTAICECLAVNLSQCWDVRLIRRDTPGDYHLSWNKSEKRSRGLDRANRAAGFAYNGLKALSEEYPDNVRVEWMRD
jgi:uncharacterized protein YsxB (DUF464 family)